MALTSRPRLLAGGLLALLGLLLLVRVVHGTPSMGGDNAGYLVLADALLQGEGYRDLYLPGAPPHTKYPPLYPVVLAGAMALGASTWWHFILLSAVLVTGAGVLVLLWASERRGVAFGIGIGALSLLSPAFLSAGTEILSEPLFLVWTFLALWGAERWDRIGLRRERAEGAGGPVDAEAGGPAEAGPGALLWLLVACGGALAAWWTRSAGLPLVLAVGGLLLLRRRRAAAGAFAVLFAVPAWLWSRRGPAVEGGYISELWMVNPYRPELGTVGPGGIAERILANARFYLETGLPRGLLGLEAEAGTALALLLVALGAAGWILALRRGPGATELFLPLYAGVILVWPEVWASERFALPLLPLVLLYAGEAAGAAVRRVEGGEAVPGRSRPWPGSRWAGPVVASLAALLLLPPQLAGWWERGGIAAFCRAAEERSGAFGCHAVPVREFVAAAYWSGENLPDSAVVLSRKPRIFHVLSGLPSQVFPFSSDPEAFLEAVEETGATHVVLDYLDAQASRYLVPVILARPGIFCLVRSFGTAEGEAPTRLLGIVAGGGAPGDAEGGGVSLSLCPAAVGEESPLDLTRTGIPFLEG